MSKRSPKSVEEKLELVLLYLEQGVSISTLASSYGVSKTTINCAKLSYFESKCSQKVDKTAY